MRIICTSPGGQRRGGVLERNLGRQRHGRRGADADTLDLSEMGSPRVRKQEVGGVPHDFQDRRGSRPERAMATRWSDRGPSRRSGHIQRQQGSVEINGKEGARET